MGNYPPLLGLPQLYEHHRNTSRLCGCEVGKREQVKMKYTVHVKPGSRKESIEWVENLFGEKTLVVKIREKPVDGEANR